MALTIDENGQARTAEHKVAIARRLIGQITTDYGLAPSDVIVDCLTFTIATGQEESRRDALETIEAIRADVIGMSGLLVKSTVIMKENLEEMNSRGVAPRWPVLLGGAALTRSYVENDLSELYAGDVRYARDAFEGLRLMDGLMAAKRGEHVEVDEGERARVAERKARRARSLRIAARRAADQPPPEPPARSDVATDVPVPAPPFWGSRVVKGIAVADYAALLDERATFVGPVGPAGRPWRRRPGLRRTRRDRGQAAAALLAGPAGHRRRPRVGGCLLRLSAVRGRR